MRRLFEGGAYFEIIFLSHWQQWLDIVCKDYVILRFQCLPSIFAEIEW